ncbi:hypothetical protein DSL64_21600 [Dyadobacter luteus]|uniref:Uncharacterized protein n=1 Tax=Dyadobacter luteus TaxID=2259619 RepID=A0A3D8Y6B0_9BACT|nr:hypothetical protein DSL64_21600 [Dyadobacter luteus]
MLKCDTLVHLANHGKAGGFRLFKKSFYKTLSYLTDLLGSRLTCRQILAGKLYLGLKFVKQS